MREKHLSVNGSVLDRQIFDRRGEPVGRVDDIEFTDLAAGELARVAPGVEPMLTALLCGPAALGPRLGWPLGARWSALARHPDRVPIEQVARLDRTRIRLRVGRAELGIDRLRDWVRERLIVHIPGSGHASQRPDRRDGRGRTGPPGGSGS